MSTCFEADFRDDERVVNAYRQEPLGILLHRVARSAAREFEACLEGSGGSRSWWMILRTLSDGRVETQAELAETVGLRGATLTHHLDALEKAGLVARIRNPADRRNHSVMLTPAGKRKFAEMLERVKAFDARMRRGLSARKEEELRDALRRIESSLGDDEPSPP
jgi:MarR family transcriptional regulator, transcriptional regulator for hemolysin